ncbi:MAG TPA: SpoIIE family protein phosphatase [Acidobacteriaceae bacterium]|nr:SpoIIE family protein phosphatase [Acidobacteriaceae bacterium]
MGSMQTNLTKLPYLLLAILIVGSMLFYAASTAAIFDSFLNPDRVRPPLDYSREARFPVLPESKRAGMQAEDDVISVNGVPFMGMAGLIGQTFHARPGQTFSIVYRNRLGGMHTAQVQLMARRTNPPNLSGWLINILLVLLFPAFCLLLGYWVVLARPLEWNAWFLLGIMNVVPAFIGRTGYFPGFLAPFTIFWQLFAFQWMYVSLILFSIYFPVRSRTDIRHPWIKWLIIVPQVAIIPAQIWLGYGRLYHVRAVRPYLSATPLMLAQNFFDAVSLCIFIAAIVGKLFAVPAPAPDARRRLGVVAAGSLLGLGPLLVLLVTSTLSEQTFMEVAPSWALVTVGILFTLFPLSLAYTVIVQRALDLRIILRQGTRYAFARGTLWVLQVIVFTFLGFRLFHNYFAHTSGPVAQLITPVVFVVVVLFLHLRLARPLSLWVDRRFFREAYSVDQILVDLSEQARTFTETEPLLRTITERISQTLHVDRISFLLRQGKLFQLQFAQGIPDGVDVSLPENSSTLRALALDRSPKRVYREHPDPWLALAAPAEVAVLDRLEAELLLPLPGRASLIGVMALGPKLSEEPYSRSDRRLLSSVALQTGLAIENSALVHHLAQESAQRQRIDREIEIARQVQERLLPQIYPLVKGIDFAGYSRTAQEVGGDYYDFIALENGRLGIAIGDVSGKGISSALLMASIRAALHGLTFSGTLSLARIIEGLNRIIYDSSTSNRFVTFFFGEYDPSTRTLDYVNAGHNAPVLLRPTAPGQDSFCSPEGPCMVQRLETGGPVLGIFTDVQYEQGRLQLQPYDVLIAYTDGISEAMTTGYEEWGEDRLLAAARLNNHRTAQEIVTAVVECTDRFTAGAEQNDDLSLVVLKVL